MSRPSPSTRFQKSEALSAEVAHSASRPARDAGFTLVEVLIAAALFATLILGLSNVMMTALGIQDEGSRQAESAQEAHFAMQRMVHAIRRAPRLTVPLGEDTRTGTSESSFDPGVLAVGLDPELDRNQDGYADADNDKDGRVDEDWPADANRDGVPGILGIDDDNSGYLDTSFAGSGDDDETGFYGGSGEDPIDGIDNDGDGAIDEDPPADMNDDGAPGIAGVDDDGDGLVDEGDRDDDDEDGQTDEDWLDTVVYYLSGDTLIERHPDPEPADGEDYTERVIASNVVSFRVTRLPRGNRRADLVELFLEVGTDGDPIALTSVTRVGTALE